MSAVAWFDDLAAELAPRGATTGAMFGARSLRLANKVFGTFGDESVTFSVSTPDDVIAESVVSALDRARGIG